jgi:hypothetical protein
MISKLQCLVTTARATVLVVLVLWALSSKVGTAFAAATNGSAALTEASFNKITQNNIFNPRRKGYQPREIRDKPQTRPIADWFALVGIIDYDKGMFAFFEGSKSEYQKVAKASEKITDFKVESIDAAAVKLVRGTNTIVMPVNMQMRREEGGEWKLAPRSETYVADNGRERSDRSRFDRNNRGRSSNNSRNYSQPSTTPTETTTPGPENILSAVQQMILQEGAEPLPPPPDVILEPGPDNSNNSGDTNEDPVLRALRERRERETNP